MCGSKKELGWVNKANRRRLHNVRYICLALFKWKSHKNRPDYWLPGVRENSSGRGGCGCHRIAWGILVKNSFASDWGGGHRNQHVTKLQGTKYTQTHTQKWVFGEIQMDCLDLNFLVVILYYNYAKCYHWGKLGERYIISIISYNCKWIYKSGNKFVKETFN